MRIVSLLASGTEIVHALGLGENLVGISHECDHPAELMDRPRVSRPRFDPAGLDSGAIDQAVRTAMAEHGSVYEVDGDLLERLRPDLVLTQAVCEVCAVPTPGVREEVRRRGMHAQVLSLDAHTIDDILDSVAAVGRAAAVSERAHRVRGELERRLEAVASAVGERERADVLALEWLDPPFAPGHWVPEMIEAAGGRCLVGTAGDRSQQLEWDALAPLAPDALVVMPCGYDVRASMQDAASHADRLRRVAPGAINAGRAWIVNGSAYFNRSGPRFVRGVEILAALLHPDLFPAPPSNQAVSFGTVQSPS